MTPATPVTPRSAGTGLQVVAVGRGPGGIGYRYRVGACMILQTSPTHLSISHVDRDPTWAEIAAARYALLPRMRDCVMVLPPEDDYVNVHEHCFHVHLLRELAPGGRFHNRRAW